jgi:hypothetical protein
MNMERRLKNICIPSIQFFPRISETTTHFLLSLVLAPVLLSVKANVGKASTCHIERRKRQSKVRAIITVWAMVAMLTTTKKRILLNITCFSPASFVRYILRRKTTYHRRSFLPSQILHSAVRTCVF